MRIGSFAILDSETLGWIYRPLREYSGPVSFAKGGKQAQNNENTADTLSSNLTGQGLGINSSLIPTLQNEVNNPIGFSQQALDEMQTAGGQTAAGSQAAAQQRAALAASRTGNLASLPSIQDKLARSGAQDQSNNALGLDIANNNAKLKQQQEGLGGLAALGQEDTGAGLNALGLANAANQQVMQAGNWWQPLLGQVVSGAEQGAGAYYGGQKGCWIAAATFDGWDDERTSIVRNFLFGKFRKTWYGKILTDLYAKYGERLSKSRAAMIFFRPLFRAILRYATHA